MGDDKPIEALKSSNNTVIIGEAINLNQDLYAIIDASINFTPSLGIPIHGIIGYDVFKDFIVEINYMETLGQNHCNVFDFFSALFSDPYNRYAWLASDFIYRCNGSWDGRCGHECHA